MVVGRRVSRGVVVGACAGLGLVVLATSLEGEAHAQTSPVDFQVSYQLGVSYLRKVPTLTSTAVSTPAREIASQDVPVSGSLVGLGGTLDSSMTFDGRWLVPLVGIGVYAPIGSYDTVQTSIDGSLATYRPWTTFSGDLLLPGIGYRYTRRRWMFAADVRTGASFLSGHGSVADGATSTRLELRAISFAVIAELEACRRLDPVTRACFQVAPRLYDFGAVNGATFGIRMEIGR